MVSGEAEVASSLIMRQARAFERGADRQIGLTASAW